MHWFVMESNGLNKILVLFNFLLLPNEISYILKLVAQQHFNTMVYISPQFCAINKSNSHC